MKSLWLPFCSGILLSLTLPMFGVWPLVWVALVPLFLFASHKHITYRRLCAGVFFFGTPYAIAVLYPVMRVTSWWWPTGLESFGMLGLELKFAGLILLLGFWALLFFLLPLFIFRYFGKHSASGVTIAIAWALVEWLRSSFALFGYSWGVIGYTLIDTQYLKHIASLGTVYALSFLIVLGNMFFTQLFPLFFVQQGSIRKRIYFIGRTLIETPRTYLSVWFFVIFFTGALCFGIYREQHILSPLAACTSTPLRVAVVSHHVAIEESIGATVYYHYRTKINEAIAEGAMLVLLPENAFPFFELNESNNLLNKHSIISLQEQDELYADFLSISRTHPEVMFAVGLHTNKDHMHYNSLVLFQRGEPIAYYHKRKRVPFAEYMPLGLTIPVVEPIDAGTRDQYFAVDGVNASALICSEVNDTSIDLHGVGIILSPSNDSVFASPTVGLVHHNIARMRALEANAYLLRAAEGGISSIIDPNGSTQRARRGNGVVIADICLVSSK